MLPWKLNKKRHQNVSTQEELQDLGTESRSEILAATALVARAEEKLQKAENNNF